jgi:hypothetical protein
MPTRSALFLLLIVSALLRAAGLVYVVLWFDTGDYIEAAADDAALLMRPASSRAGMTTESL